MKKSTQIKSDVSPSDSAEVEVRSCVQVDHKNSYVTDIAEDEQIDIASARILEKYRRAFQELAK